MDWSWLVEREDVEVSGPVRAERVAEAEAVVGAFPPAYRSFVLACGTAVVPFQEVAGLGDVPKHMDVVGETLFERSVPHRALPEDLLVVHNDGAGNLYCVRVDVGEAPGRDEVVAWWRDDDSAPEVIADSFDGWIRSLFDPLPREKVPSPRIASEVDLR